MILEVDFDLLFVFPPTSPTCRLVWCLIETGLKGTACLLDRLFLDLLDFLEPVRLLTDFLDLDLDLDFPIRLDLVRSFFSLDPFVMETEVLIL